MEKREFQKIVKKRFKEIGFQFKGNNGYKILDNDYLIGVCLEHHSYCKAYHVEYGVVYLPDINKIPFRGWFDWYDQFLFTKNIKDDLASYDIENLSNYDTEKLIGYFEYELREPEELMGQIEINIKRKMKLILEKEFVLKYYYNNLDILARLPYCTIEKLLRLYHFDKNEIRRLRQQWGYDQCDF